MRCGLLCGSCGGLWQTKHRVLLSAGSLSTPVRRYHGTCHFTKASAIGRTKVLRIRRTGTFVFFKSPQGGWGMPYIEVLPIRVIGYALDCRDCMYSLHQREGSLIIEAVPGSRNLKRG